MSVNAHPGLAFLLFKNKDNHTLTISKHPIRFSPSRRELRAEENLHGPDVCRVLPASFYLNPTVALRDGRLLPSTFHRWESCGRREEITCPRCRTTGCEARTPTHVCLTQGLAPRLSKSFGLDLSPGEGLRTDAARPQWADVTETAVACF